MPLPTRPPEWGMMRSPFLRMAAITATLVPCQSRRRCSRWSWAWKDLSWRDVELRADQGRGRGAAPARDTPPEDRAQSQGHGRAFPRWAPAAPSSHLPLSGHHPDAEDAGLVPCLHHVVLDQLPGKEAGTRCHHKAAIQPCPHRGGGTGVPVCQRGPQHLVLPGGWVQQGELAAEQGVILVQRVGDDLLLLLLFLCLLCLQALCHLDVSQHLAGTQKGTSLGTLTEDQGLCHGIASLLGRDGWPWLQAGQHLTSSMSFLARSRSGESMRGGRARPKLWGTMV